MLSKKFRLRKLNKIIATSVLMGACLIFGQGQESGATGFRGVNSGASGAGRGRGTGTGTPGSSSNLGGAGRGSSASSIGTGSGGLGASGNLGGSGRRNSIGTGSGGASSSTSSGSPSSSGVRGAGSSTSLSSGSSLLGHGAELRVQQLLKTIQNEIETGNGPNYGTYVALLEEVPNSTKHSNDGVRHKYSSGGITVEMFVGNDGNIKGASIDTRGASGSSSSGVSGASSSTSSASGGVSSGNGKVRVQELFDEIESDLQRKHGFSNPEIYKELLNENPDSINDLGDGRLQYKYISNGGTVEMVVDSGDGSVKSALVDIGEKGSYIDFDRGWSQTNS